VISSRGDSDLLAATAMEDFSSGCIKGGSLTDRQSIPTLMLWVLQLSDEYLSQNWQINLRTNNTVSILNKLTKI